MGDEGPLTAGTGLGSFLIESLIGEGAMARVYRARQPSLARSVALKTLKPSLARDPHIVRRFLREAKIAASLTNPNTVSIYDFGQADDGSLFLAMELLEGETL